jgi:citrate synthase
MRDSELTDDRNWLRTSIGHSTPDSITVRGLDLASEVMGRMSFSDLAFLLVSGRKPTDGESLLFNAVLASLADHGLTPGALATRFTYTGAPESVQGVIAAGLLGAGSVFLGPVEDTARFLHAIIEQVNDEKRDDEAELMAAASQAVRAALQEGRRIPGLGHPIHTEVDPRTPRLFQIADDVQLAGAHVRLLKLVGEAYRTETGKALPINGAGAAGAALADLGFPPSIARGFAVLARTAGLVAHLAEESERPIGMKLWREVNESATDVADDD